MVADIQIGVMFNQTVDYQRVYIVGGSIHESSTAIVVLSVDVCVFIDQSIEKTGFFSKHRDCMERLVVYKVTNANHLRT